VFAVTVGSMTSIKEFIFFNYTRKVLNSPATQQ